MNWNDDYHKRSLDDFETMAHPPSGGRVKLVILGVLLPLGLLWLGARAWINEEATWLGDGDDLTVVGDAAKAVGVAYLGAAMIAHFRWCWGLLACHRAFSIGVSLGIILVLGGCGTSLYQQVI